jgi:hypothetical protein
MLVDVVIAIGIGEDSPVRVLDECRSADGHGHGVSEREEIADRDFCVRWSMRAFAADDRRSQK